mmetsp:Transcript_10463/g.25923  ORF Transcript_10463/g.25923 Transcript_10463/m.25923 type:complete len:270 (-) Transcript_10463:530-1339(-)
MWVLSLYLHVCNFASLRVLFYRESLLACLAFAALAMLPCVCVNASGCLGCGCVCSCPPLRSYRCVACGRSIQSSRTVARCPRARRAGRVEHARVLRPTAADAVGLSECDTAAHQTLTLPTPARSERRPRHQPPHQMQLQPARPTGGRYPPSRRSQLLWRRRRRWRSSARSEAGLLRWRDLGSHRSRGIRRNGSRQRTNLGSRRQSFGSWLAKGRHLADWSQGRCAGARASTCLLAARRMRSTRRATLWPDAGVRCHCAQCRQWLPPTSL